jgi:hypothetical protein
MRKNKYVIIILSALLLLFGGSYIYYSMETSDNKKAMIYFSEDFDTQQSRWQFNDANWETNSAKGVVHLSRKEFITPNINTVLASNEIPQESFVWHMKVKVTAFTDEATTLGAIYFPTGSITVVVNEEGKLGLAHHLFKQPTYSKKSFSTLEKGEWADVYVMVDEKTDKLLLFLNGKKIMQTEWEQETYPIQEIWLGTVWLKGAGKYGSAVNISFDEVTIADENILPKPSYYQFYYNSFSN